VFRTTSAKSAVPPGHDPDGVAVATKPAAPKKEVAKARQETLPLEGVSRGRFDKSEPTLYEGEDLDVPTFLRRGISLKR
jgi:cell division protein FtsZ